MVNGPLKGLSQSYCSPAVAEAILCEFESEIDESRTDQMRRRCACNESSE